MHDRNHPSIVEVQRLLDLIASKASTLKLTLETVQCMAIDLRLALTGDSVSEMTDSIRQAQQELASILDGLRDEIDALLAKVAAATRRVQRRSLQ